MGGQLRRNRQAAAVERGLDVDLADALESVREEGVLGASALEPNAIAERDLGVLDGAIRLSRPWDIHGVGFVCRVLWCYRLCHLGRCPKERGERGNKDGENLSSRDLPTLYGKKGELCSAVFP